MKNEEREWKKEKRWSQKAPGFESMNSAFSEEALEETTQSMSPLCFGAIGLLIVSIGLP